MDFDFLKRAVESFAQTKPLAAGFVAYPDQRARGLSPPRRRFSLTRSRLFAPNPGPAVVRSS